MREFQTIEELRTAVGTHLGYSEWHTISQDDVVAFAELTGDYQWIHVDVARASTGPYGTTIVHGFFTLSLVPLLTSEVYRVAGVGMGINYGASRLRFPSPLPVGASVRAGVEVLSVEPRTQGTQMETRVTIEREGGTKPVCVFDSLALLVSPAGEDDGGADSEESSGS